MVLPTPVALSTEMAPLIARTMPKTTDNSRPVPCHAGLVAKNGSNIMTRVARSKPQPVSWTDSKT